MFRLRRNFTLWPTPMHVILGAASRLRWLRAWVLVRHIAAQPTRLPAIPGVTSAILHQHGVPFLRRFTDLSTRVKALLGVSLRIW